MTSARTALSTLLVGAACITGLSACGGGDTLSDSSFIDKCKKEVDTNATTKAYSTDICKCTQDKLKAQGLGDKEQADKSVVKPADTALNDCANKIAG